MQILAYLPDDINLQNLSEIADKIGENEPTMSLNSVSQKNATIHSNTDEIIQTLAIKLVNKTAVTTTFGFYEFTRMPFGLRNAAQSLMKCCVD